MVKVKTPINTKNVKDRAAKKLSKLNANPGTTKTSDLVVTGNMVKPIHISKTDPLVRKILNS
ncbi:hypothetical protein [Sporosarcina sp. FSL K6-1508]|uniref:hypothetical protein n=1 Tax=Sporosarcina sp. FSL K6-1508 TaxID=2921553 RepID=UPI0030FB2C16